MSTRSLPKTDSLSVKAESTRMIARVADHAVVIGRLYGKLELHDALLTSRNIGGYAANRGASKPSVEVPVPGTLALATDSQVILKIETKANESATG